MHKKYTNLSLLLIRASPTVLRAVTLRPVTLREISLISPNRRELILSARSLRADFISSRARELIKSARACSRAYIWLGRGGVWLYSFNFNFLLFNFFFNRSNVGMPPRVTKSGRRTVRVMPDDMSGPVHLPPPEGTTIEDLRILHEMPQGFTHRSVTALDTVQVLVLLYSFTL